MATIDKEMAQILERLPTIISDRDTTALSALLSHHSEGARKAVAVALGETRDAAALPHLMAMTSEHSARVRRETVKALGLIGGGDGASRLVELLPTKEPRFDGRQLKPSVC